MATTSPLELRRTTVPRASIEHVRNGSTVIFRQQFDAFAASEQDLCRRCRHITEIFVNIPTKNGAMCRR